MSNAPRRPAAQSNPATKPQGPAGWAERVTGQSYRRVTGIEGRRRWGLAFAAGAVTVLAMAPFHFWPVLFLTMPVMVWLIDADGGASPARGLRASLGAAFGAGWWFGFGYFIFGLFWIGEAFLVEAEKYALLVPFAVTLLPAGLAFFFAMAAGAARAWWPQGIARVLVLAVSIALFEWLRGHVLTGLPWNTLGYALTYPLALMQMTAVLGTYSMTIWAVGIGAVPLVYAADGVLAGRDARWALARGATIAAVPLAVFALFGFYRLAQPSEPAVDGVRFRIVQPSVPQREKWRPENQGPIFQDHLALSRTNASGRRDDLKGATHVVWPEAAMPFLPLDHPEAITAIGEMLPSGTYLFAGGLRLARNEAAGTNGAKTGQSPAERRVYNSLLVLGAGGTLTTLYDKNHLVPFGEYLPLPSLWRAFGLRGLVEMRGAFTSGPDPRPLLEVPGLPKVGALICYEAIFPGEVVQGPDRPGLLISVTNDGWFGNTTGPRQHFHQARVRAVEEGLPLIRAANNGISAVIDADGRVIHRLGMNERGVIDSDLPGARPATIYARSGDAIFFANLMLAMLMAIIFDRRTPSLGAVERFAGPSVRSALVDVDAART